MGNCCCKELNSNSNPGASNNKYYKNIANDNVHIRSKTLYNFTNKKQIKTKLNKITSEEVDNAILNWVEKTKHFHKKATSLNCIETLNEESFDEDEITKAFNEENIHMIKTFSEITSTIHLTNLTRDFYSKVKSPNFNNLNNNSISATFFNVLEELEDKFPIDNKFTEEPIKIVISSKNSKRKIPHYSLNLDFKNDNVPLLENNNLCISENIQIHKSLFSNKNNKKNINKSKIDNDSQTNIQNFFKQSTDNARLFSQGLDISSTLNQDNISMNIENIFINVEKRNIDYYLKKNSKLKLEQENLNFKGLLLSTYNNSILSKINYPISFYGTIIDWKKNKNENFDFSNIDSDLNNIFFSIGIFQDSGLLTAFISLIKHDLVFQSNFISNFIHFFKNGNCSYKFYLNGSIKYSNLDNLLPYVNDNHKNNNRLFFSFVSNISLQKLINFGEKLFFLLSNKLSLNFSNSIFYLTGWIPENFNLKTENIEPKSFWNTLFSNFSNGNLIFSLICKDSNKEISLKKEKIGNKNYLLYKNVYYIITSMDNENQIIKIKPSYIDKNSYSEKDIISLNFSNACTLFSHIYLNWNPDIFKYHYKFNSNYIHNSSYYSKAYNEDYSLEYNPQFILEIPKHNENIEIKIFIEKFIHESIYINDDISYKLFRYDGYVKIYPEDDLRNYQKEKGNIASDTLFFEPSEVDEQFLIVIMKKDKNNFNNCEISINFSLNIFSQFPLKICEIPKRKLYLKEKQICKWNDHQLFDNKQIELLYDNFLKFPQFKLTLNSINNKNYIQIILETISLSHLMIFFLENNGKLLLNTSIEEFNNKKHQNFYSNSFSYLEINDIPDGEYTIICLTSDEKKSNKEFCLQVNSLSENTKNIQLIRLSPIPKYHNTEKVIGQWEKVIYKKSEITHDFYINNFPSYEFVIKNKNICCFFLKENKKICENESLINSPYIFLKIYKKEKLNNNYKVIFNGQNSFCSLWGFFIDNLELEPGKYIIVCINKMINNDSKYKLIIQSLSPIYNLKSIIT